MAPRSLLLALACAVVLFASAEALYSAPVDKLVCFKGKQYATLDFFSPEDGQTEFNDLEEKYARVPEGWSLAPDNDDSRSVS